MVMSGSIRSGDRIRVRAAPTPLCRSRYQMYPVASTKSTAILSCRKREKPSTTPAPPSQRRRCWSWEEVCA